MEWVNLRCSREIKTWTLLSDQGLTHAVNIGVERICQTPFHKNIYNILHVLKIFINLWRCITDIKNQNQWSCKNFWAIDSCQILQYPWASAAFGMEKRPRSAICIVSWSYRLQFVETVESEALWLKVVEMHSGSCSLTHRRSQTFVDSVLQLQLKLANSSKLINK